MSKTKARPKNHTLHVALRKAGLRKKKAAKIASAFDILYTPAERMRRRKTAARKGNRPSAGKKEASKRVKDVMTEDVVTLPIDATVVDASRAMADGDIGDVVVVGEHGTVIGILTDRDIVVRTVARGEDPFDARLDDFVTDELVTVSPHQAVDDVIETMRDLAIRRTPVVDEHGGLVGIISIGDLAVERDRRSALGEISAAQPNN